MRVLVATNMWSTTDQPWRGQFVVDQVDDLAREGVEIEVFHFDGRRSRLEYPRAAARMLRLVRRDRSFDLVHAHYGLTGGLACLQARKPVVTTFHGSDVTLKSQRRISHFAARHSTAICVSSRLAKLLGLTDPHVIPVGVDTALFATVSSRRDARARLRLRADRRYVLFPGRATHPPKRYELFAETLAQLDAEELVLDHIERELVPFYLRAADVLLMTSVREGAPVTVKESLAVGTPVVSVDVGDCPDVIGGLPGCRVAAPNPTALARAVREAYDISSAAEEALRRRAEDYARGAIARRIIDVYQAVLSGQARRSAIRE